MYSRAQGVSRKEVMVTEERTQSGREICILDSGGVIFVGSQEHKAIAMEASVSVINLLFV